MRKIKTISCILISSFFLLVAKANTKEENSILVATYNGNAYKIDLDVNYYKNVSNKISKQLTGYDDAVLLKVSIDDVENFKKKSRAFLIFTFKSSSTNTIIHCGLIVKKDIGANSVSYYFDNFFYKVSSAKTLTTDFMAKCSVENVDDKNDFTLIRGKDKRDGIIGCNCDKKVSSYFMNGNETEVYQNLGKLLLKERVD